MLELAPETVSLVFNPDIIQAGDATGGLVRINFDAPVGGLKFAVTTDLPDRLRLPATAVVPEGQRSVVFLIESMPSLTGYAPHVTVKARKLEHQNVFGVRANGLAHIRFDVAEAYGGYDRTLTIRLPEPAPAAGVVVKLMQGGSEFDMPSEVAFGKGEVEKEVRIGTKPTKEPADLPITAYVQGFSSKVARVKLLPPILGVLWPVPPEVSGGTPVDLLITLTGWSPGQTVKLVASDPALPVPATITFEPGEPQKTIRVIAGMVTKRTKVTVRAKLGNQTVNTVVFVKP